MRDDLTQLINKAAYQLYRRYRAYVEAEDIRQEMWVWVAARVAKVEDMPTFKLRYKLLDAGGTYCRREKAAKSGYSPDDEVFYGLPLLRELLPFAVRDLPIVLKGVDDTNTSTARKAAAGVSMSYETAVADVRAAFNWLRDPYRAVLRAYADGDEVSAGEVTRALRAMQRKLGGRRPTPNV